MSVSTLHPVTDSAYVAAAQAVASYARNLVDAAEPVPLPVGESIRAARRLRVLALDLLDEAVRLERAQGASWAQIGAALGLGEAEARRRYDTGA